MSALVTGALGVVATAGALVVARQRRRLIEAGKTAARATDWLPTKAELKSVADPLANILLRHAPTDELGNATDLVDGIAVAVATGGFAVRALNDEPGGTAERANDHPPAPPAPAPEARP